LQVIAALARSNDVFYLHPSFGYYFEVFYQEAHGLVYKLQPYPTNTLVAPPPSSALLDENEQFWARCGATAFPTLLAATSQPKIGPTPSLVESCMKAAHLRKESDSNSRWIANYFSRALDYWGVEVQKTADFKKAAPHFERALELNPGNLV